MGIRGYTYCRNVLQLFTLRSDGAYVRSLALVSVASLLGVLAAPAHAQQTPPATARTSPGLPIVPGARVRISASTLVSPLLANYLEMKGDTAVFLEAAAGRGIWTFTLDQITRIEQSQGEKRFNSGPMLKGGLIGIPAGALAFWGATGLFNPSDSTKQYNRGGTAATGALVGGVVGVFIGSFAKAERWMSLPLPNRVSVRPYRREGMEVGIGFTF